MWTPRVQCHWFNLSVPFSHLSRSNVTPSRPSRHLTGREHTLYFYGSVCVCVCVCWRGCHWQRRAERLQLQWRWFDQWRYSEATTLWHLSAWHSSCHRWAEYSVSDCISAEVIRRQPADNHCTEEGNGKKTYWKPALQGQKVLKLNLHCCSCKKNKLSNSYAVRSHCLSFQCERNAVAAGTYKKLLKTEDSGRWIECAHLCGLLSFHSCHRVHSTVWMDAPR